jgi:hypothetical protein
MSMRKKVTSGLLLGLMSLAGVSIYDDYLIYQQCSKKAMDQAVNNPRLLAVLGEHIEKGPWYEATMGLDHEGHSASCTFSVIGSLGTANLHLRAVKFEEKRNWLSPYAPGITGGRWEVLTLEALVPSVITHGRKRLNLMQPMTDTSDVGDQRVGTELDALLNSDAHREV